MVIFLVVLLSNVAQTVYLYSPQEKTDLGTIYSGFGYDQCFAGNHFVFTPDLIRKLLDFIR